MLSEYDSITAHHYGQYRPALHKVILDEALRGQFFSKGLDIGCGAGKSAIALTEYCDQVVAIDSSEAMLKAAIPHRKITYQLTKDMHVVKSKFDIITFAGSLPYLKSQALVDQLNRLLNEKGLIAIYDFDIQLDSILEQISFDLPNLKGTYDHLTNLSGFKLGNLSFVGKAIYSTNIKLSSREIMHLILSVKAYYLALKKHFPDHEIENNLKLEVEQISAQQTHTIEAIYNYALYQKV